MKYLKLNSFSLTLILLFFLVNITFSQDKYYIKGKLINKIEPDDAFKVNYIDIDTLIEIENIEVKSNNLKILTINYETAKKYKLLYDSNNVNQMKVKYVIESISNMGETVFILKGECILIKDSYVEAKWKTQPIATIFKYRFGNWFDKPVVIENGGSFAITENYTISDYNYDPKNQIFNKGFNYSFGFLFGLGTTDINTKNSRVGSDVSSKIVTVSPGLIASAGYDRFSVGFVIGLDLGIGPNTTKWNYNGFPWAGFTFGLDIIK